MTTFNWDWLTGSEVQFIVIKAEAWQHPGGYGTGGAEGSTSLGSQKQTGHAQAPRRKISKPIPIVTHLLQRGCTF